MRPWTDGKLMRLPLEVFGTEGEVVFEAENGAERVQKGCRKGAGLRGWRSSTNWSLVSLECMLVDSGQRIVDGQGVS